MSRPAAGAAGAAAPERASRLPRPIAALGCNLRELGHLLLSGVPPIVARGRPYLALRRRLSPTPLRFVPPVPPRRPPPQPWLPRKIAFPETDLVVDGFPGSANSYLSNSLRVALGERVWVTSHFHHTVQLKRALAFGVPALVVVRRPLDAAGSLKSKEPVLWDWLILWRWIVYHRYVLRHRTELDVVLFDEVIRDLDVVVRRSGAVRRLLAGAPPIGRDAYRRISGQSRAIRGRWPVNRLLLVIARGVYRRIRDHTVAIDSIAASRSPAEP